jgi:carbon starvation protein
MVWLVIICMAAGWVKMFDADPKLGFLAHADMLKNAVASGTIPAAIKTAEAAQRMIFNDYLDAGVAAFFMISVIVIIGASVKEWYSVLGGRKPLMSSEVPFDGALAAGD